MQRYSCIPRSGFARPVQLSIVPFGKGHRLVPTIRAPHSTRSRTAPSSAAVAVKPAPIELDDEQRYKPIAWPLVRRMLRELAPFRRQYILGLSLGLLHVLADLAGPTFVKLIIDFSTLIAPVASVSFNQKLAWLAGIVLLWG